jgi:hypothetical protein
MMIAIIISANREPQRVGLLFRTKIVECGSALKSAVMLPTRSTTGASGAVLVLGPSLPEPFQISAQSCA